MIAIVEITEKCNMNCMYCYEGQAHNSGIEMTPQEFETVIQNTQGIVDEYVISGGEPFMHSSCIEIIRILERYGKKINFISNGSLLNKIMASNYQIDTLTISLDSFIGKYNRLRSEVFPPIKDSIIKLLEANSVKRLFLQLILNKVSCNRKNIEDILTFCAENQIGLKCKLLDRCNNVGASMLCLSENEVLSTIAFIEQIIYDKTPQIQIELPPQSNVFCKCGIISGKPNIRIRPDGKMFGCEKANKKDYYLGSAYYKTDYSSELHKIRARIIQRMMIMSKTTCCACVYNAICNKGCPILFNPDDNYSRCEKGLAYGKNK